MYQSPRNHACVVYDPAVAPPFGIAFLLEGLVRGNQCLYLAHDSPLGEVHEALREHGVDRATLHRAVTVHSAQELYQTGGRFLAEDMIKTLWRLTEDALAGGFSGLCVTGEMSWATEADYAELLWYEARVNDVAATLPFYGLCQYAINGYPAHLLNAVIATHPSIGVNEHYHPNPFYEPPVLIVGDGGDDLRLTWRLHQIKRLVPAHDGPSANRPGKC